jgi:hypothetical protein
MDKGRSVLSLYDVHRELKGFRKKRVRGESSADLLHVSDVVMVV